MPDPSSPGSGVPPPPGPPVPDDAGPACPAPPVPAPRPPRRLPGRVAWALVALLAALLVGIAVRRVITDNSDFDGFHRAGEAVLAGQDIYGDKAVRRYLPCFPLFLAPLALLPLPWAAGVWALLSLAACAGTLRELALLLGIGPRTVRALWGTAILTSPFWVDGLVMGQVNPLLVYLMTLGIRWAAQNRCGSAGAILGVAVALKLTPALVVFLALWRMRMRLVVAAGGTLLLIAGALPAAVWGPGRTAELYRMWAGEALVGGVGGEDAAAGRSLRFNNQSIPAWTTRLLTPVDAGTRKRRFTVNVAALDAETAGWVARALLAALAGATLWAWGRPGRRLSPAAAPVAAAPSKAAPDARSVVLPAAGASAAWLGEASLAMAGTVLLSPIAWTSHFQAMALPVAILCRAAADPADPARAAARAGLSALALSLAGLASPVTRALGCPLLGCLAVWAATALWLRRAAPPATLRP